jgi:hypothetical protein
VWADQHGFSRPFVSQVLREIAWPTQRMASYLGVRLESRPRGGARPGSGRKRKSNTTASVERVGG